MRSILFLLLLILQLIVVTPVRATSEPQFPSCVVPRGNIKAHYDTGSHGIIGQPQLFVGSDSVYEVSENTLIQCFCPAEGSEGIQTNWWKIGQVTEDEVNRLKNIGYYYVPTGKVWGLEDTSYVAKNINYVCKTVSGVSSESGTGGQITAEAASTIAGDVLAATGSSKVIFTLSGLILITFVLGLLFKKKIA